MQQSLWRLQSLQIKCPEYNFFVVSLHVTLLFSQCVLKWGMQKKNTSFIQKSIIKHHKNHGFFRILPQISGTPVFVEGTGRHRRQIRGLRPPCP